MKRIAMLILLIGFAIALPAILLMEKWERKVKEEWESENGGKFI